MRKRIVESVRPAAASSEAESWLDLATLAEVELSSEDAAHPIEHALQPGEASGWRAGEPGRQSIRVVFAQPQRLRRIALRFVEEDETRTQEYVLRWSPDGGRSFRDIVRQQWNFSPRGATVEAEDHRVELDAVSVLELSIDPDQGGHAARASLQALRLA